MQFLSTGVNGDKSTSCYVHIINNISNYRRVKKKFTPQLNYKKRCRNLSIVSRRFIASAAGVGQFALKLGEN